MSLLTENFSYLQYKNFELKLSVFTFLKALLLRQVPQTSACFTCCLKVLLTNSTPALYNNRVWETVTLKEARKQIVRLYKMIETMENKRNLQEALKNRETLLIVIEVTAASAIFIAALLGNILLCLAIYKVRALRKIQNYYIVALSTSDLLLTLLCVSLSFVALSLGRWPFGDTICQIQGSLTYFLGSFSLLNMTLIAVNRYVKMARSVNIYQKLYTKNNVLLSIGACAILAGVLTGPHVLHKFCFHPGILNCSACKSEHPEDHTLHFAFHAVLFAVSYPVIIFCYYKVFRKIRAHFAQIADSMLNRDVLKSFAEEVKITKILSAILIAFVICWTPTFTVVSFDMLQGNYPLQRQVYLIAFFATGATAAFNPVIYGLMQKQFREAYKKILTCTKNNQT